MAYTRDTTLGELLADPKVKPILEQYFPGVADNPMVSMAKGMTLNAIVDNPLAGQMGITSEKVDQFLDQVNKVV